jgi:post-segregation antitoxin (ccd killing protein)
MTLKNRIRIGSAVDKIIYDDLRNLSKTTRIPMSRLLDEAIKDLIRKYRKKQK